MRNIYVPIVVSVSLLFLAGCAASAPDALPTPQPTESTPSASPTPSAEPPLLATSQDASDALQTGPDDDRKPNISFFAVLDADAPQTFEQSSNPLTGAANLRIACASEGSTPVTVEFTPAGGATKSTEAPCGQALEMSTGFVTSQGETFDLSTTWKVVVTSSSRAAFAVGIIRD